MFTGKIGKLDGWDGSPYLSADATSPMAPLRLGSGRTHGASCLRPANHEAMDQRGTV